MPATYLHLMLHGQKGDKTTFRDSSGRTQGSATQSGSRISIRDGVPASLLCAVHQESQEGERPGPIHLA